MLVDKYDMTVEQNIALAKRLMVDSIWKSTVFEGFAVTFPETSEVIDTCLYGEINENERENYYRNNDLKWDM